MSEKLIWWVFDDMVGILMIWWVFDDMMDIWYFRIIFHTIKILNCPFDTWNICCKGTTILLLWGRCLQAWNFFSLEARSVHQHTHYTHTVKMTLFIFYIQIFHIMFIGTGEIPMTFTIDLYWNAWHPLWRASPYFLCCCQFLCPHDALSAYVRGYLRVCENDLSKQPSFVCIYKQSLRLSCLST